MKKFLITILIFTILISSNVYAAQDIKLYINGSEVLSDYKPVMIDNRVFVPLRIVAQKLGLTPQWNSDTKEITLTGYSYGVSTTVKLQIGSTARYINSSYTKMDTAPVIIDSVTYIPARYVAEAYNNYSAWWSQSESTIYICQRTSLANADVPDFGNFANSAKQSYNNRPDYLEYYKYELLYNGTAERYMQLLEDNGYVHTMQPSGATIVHKLVKNSTVIYMGEDMYNWAMYFTFQDPKVVEIENDDYSVKYPNPKLE